MHLNLSPLEIWLWGATALLFIIHFVYTYSYYTAPIKRWKNNTKQPQATETPSVSVIVYTKNESENLQKMLPLLLSQDYPTFEIIVINDGSTDESYELLQTFEAKHKNLYHSFVPEGVKYLSRKKLALTIGIKAAKHDILLFTDANCYPNSTQWIASMARNFVPGIDIVLGFCCYPESNSFEQRIAALDNLHFGMDYLAAAIRKSPYMGNGRNLAYRKELFFKQKGYAKTLNLQAGEDDLFINSVANKSNTFVELSTESIVEQKAFDRFKTWKEMKASRNSTIPYLKGGHVFGARLGGFIQFSLLIALLLLIVIACFTMQLWSLLGALTLYIIYYSLKLITLHRWASQLQKPKLIRWVPLLSVCLVFYNSYIYIYRLFKGNRDYTFRIDNR